mmetsp:Transcript_24545/g.50957  ORF Transcript_24545/g.50957 Transcript_24545/m.50957 type:complete len:214 (-) Transcript_24545:353-994(-)
MVVAYSALGHVPATICATVGAGELSGTRHMYTTPGSLIWTSNVADVSVWLMRGVPFNHCGAAESPTHVPPWHWPDRQSPLTRHCLPLLHLGQVPPPQSTSVSAPFVTPSLHVTSVHLPLSHTPLAQSEFWVQSWPPPHFEQSGPPQSMPVSWPLRTPSVHVGLYALPVHRSPNHSPEASQTHTPLTMLPWASTTGLDSALHTPCLLHRSSRHS